MQFWEEQQPAWEGAQLEVRQRHMPTYAPSRTGRVSRAFHTDYHWDRLRSYFVLPSHARRLVAVMCRVL
jgi:hypothetical protein